MLLPWSTPARPIRRRTAFPPLHSLHAAAAVAAHDLVAGSALPKASRAAAPGQDRISTQARNPQISERGIFMLLLCEFSDDLSFAAADFLCQTSMPKPKQLKLLRAYALGARASRSLHPSALMWSCTHRRIGDLLCLRTRTHPLGGSPEISGRAAPMTLPRRNLHLPPDETFSSPDAKARKVVAEAVTAMASCFRASAAAAAARPCTLMKARLFLT